jgi:predicted RNase H-like nuclease (RuvC/YqgF family)
MTPTNFKLENDDLQKLKDYVEQYAAMWNIIENLSNRLERILEEKDSLTSEIIKMNTKIENLRDSENLFNEYLKDKYGEFKINFETFECTKS